MVQGVRAVAVRDRLAVRLRLLREEPMSVSSRASSGQTHLPRLTLPPVLGFLPAAEPFDADALRLCPAPEASCTPNCAYAIVGGAPGAGFGGRGRRGAISRQ